MGFWNFLTGSGKKVSDGAPDADALKKEVADLGLEAEGLEIEVTDGVVKVSGTAASQEAKEKVILAVGNIEGVSGVEDLAGGDDPVLHEVKAGDTLWAISEKTLGNGARYTEIFEANRPMLSHPDKIYPGQMLRIPQ